MSKNVRKSSNERVRGFMTSCHCCVVFFFCFFFGIGVGNLQLYHSMRNFPAASHHQEVQSGYKKGKKRNLPASFLSPTLIFHLPWREQRYEPLIRGFRFASTQPRVDLMNKSNEWHIIIGQGGRDGQRVGASGHKPEIICLENL